MRVSLIVDHPYRDLPGAVLLALRLCKSGVTCYLVPFNKREREVWHLAPDFVLLNYLRKNIQEFAKQLVEANIQIGVMDTEGIWANWDHYELTLPEDTDLRNKVKGFFTWGPQLAEIAEQRCWYSKKQITVTGSPRFDLYKNPWNRASKQFSLYANEYPKPMVLISSKAGLANPQFSTPESIINAADRTYGFKRDEYIERQNIQKATMSQLIQLANSLASSFPEVTFVYRPHPFENIRGYDGMIQNDNLHVIKYGDISGWILRASAVIQRNCSTAIDATLGGVPALSPRWIESWPLLESAEAMSVPCDSENILVKTLRSIINGEFDVPQEVKNKQKTVIDKWFHKVDGNSHRRVSDKIIEMLSKSQTSPKRSLCKEHAYGLHENFIGTRRNVAKVARHLRLSLNLPTQLSFSKFKTVKPIGFTDRYTEKKFSLSDVENLVEPLISSSLINETSALDPVEVSTVKEKDLIAPYQSESIVIAPSNVT
ncbi:MAG TPA: hypothetical protein DGN60_06610 [Chloroflexi bacterium]|nr:hypothetical protein [Chloroflexota bacterium]|tara:strand:+ start:521 stop:1975 length:1455 start_codon:yes stop_codon:yes gene_type:complete